MINNKSYKIIYTYIKQEKYFSPDFFNLNLNKFGKIMEIV